MWTQSVQREFTAHMFGEAFPRDAAAAALSIMFPVGQPIITAADMSDALKVRPEEDFSETSVFFQNITSASGSLRWIFMSVYLFMSLLNPPLQDCS